MNKEYSTGTTYINDKEILSFLPKPSNKDINTLPQDYNKKRFYFDEECSESAIDIDEPEVISQRNRIWKGLTNLEDENIDKRDINPLRILSNHSDSRYNIWIFYKKEVDDNILKYCKENGIDGYIQIVKEIVENTFSNIKDIEMCIEEDPEIEEDYLLIKIRVEQEVKEALDSYERFVKEFVEEVPYPERNKIRLTYYLA